MFLDSLEKLKVFYIRRLFLTLPFLVFSCNLKTSFKESQYILIIYKDSIAYNNNFVYANEVSSGPNGNGAKEIINQIQDLSENKWLTSKLPKDRLSQKLAVLKKCLSKNSQDCDYVPEGYEIQSITNGLANVAYTYNQLGSSDSYFKYGCYDLRSEKRLVPTDLFKEPHLFLGNFNKKYISQLSDELSNYEEDEDQEYDVISHYIETKEPFQLSDLNNFELVLQDEKFTSIRFHYNGLGGNYKSAVPNGFVEYSLKELEPQLKKSFLDRLN